MDGNQATIDKDMAMIPIENIEDFPKHPFGNRSAAKMNELAESIKSSGILNPVLLLPIENKEGYFYAISGHGRRDACKLAGIQFIPAIIKHVSMEEATVMMIDANLQQREGLLISEKARAYSMKYEAIKKSSAASQFETRIRSDEILAKDATDSRATIQRLIKISNLIPALMRHVDLGAIKLAAAYEISFLSADNQTTLSEAINSVAVFPKVAQARSIRGLSDYGLISLDEIIKILNGNTTKRKNPIKVSAIMLQKYFPETADNKTINREIENALIFFQQFERLIPKDAAQDEIAKMGKAFMIQKERIDELIRKQREQQKQ